MGIKGHGETFYKVFNYNSMINIKMRNGFNHSNVLSCLIIFSIFLATFFAIIPCSSGRFYIDINSPSIRKIKIAIPDFINMNNLQNHNAALTAELSGIISNDLEISSYFKVMDKSLFLVEKDDLGSLDDIIFKDWSVIGAELLLMGTYYYVGNKVLIEFRLYDVFWGKSILSKKVIGHIKDSRHLMHSVSNSIIRKLTGHNGITQTHLAFVSNASGYKEIFYCDYDGSNCVQLTFDKNINLLPRLSPDGQKLIYTSYKDNGPKLYMKNLASGITKRISSRPGLNIGTAWSPDGKMVALTLSIKGNPDLFTMDLTGKIISRLTNYWGIDVSPTFSPKGNKIAYVSNRSGKPNIYTMTIADGKKQRLTFKGKYNSSPSWSIMDQIVFVSKEGSFFDLFTLNPYDGQLKQLTKNQGNNEDPCWSPDGRYIVFSSNREGRYHIYIMNADGQNQKRITFGKGDHTCPSWSP